MLVHQQGQFQHPMLFCRRSRHCEDSRSDRSHFNGKRIDAWTPNSALEEYEEAKQAFESSLEQKEQLDANKRLQIVGFTLVSISG